MNTIEKIKKEITSLSGNEFQSLRRWIDEKDWNEWEKEILRDSECGKLDFLVNEANEESYLGKPENL